MTASARPHTGASLLSEAAEEAEREIAAAHAISVAGARVVATGLSKAYGSQAVLRDIDLRLAPASLIAVAGSNGVGKSTLLACLAGVVRHEGHVLLDGQRLGRRTGSRIAYLPQRLRLPGSASGREVLRLFSAIAGRADRVEVPAGFLPRLDKPMGQLSGGQAQRIALAAVLQGRPDLVLLDEPFANLDDVARQQAHALLSAHRDAGATVLIASPTALDLLAMTDRVLLLEGGCITFDGVPSRYAGRLEMVVWVRPGEVPIEQLASLGHIIRVRQEGEWVAIECHEDRAIGLVRDLEALGIPADGMRLGGPVAEARLSASPGSPTPGTGR